MRRISHVFALAALLAAPVALSAAQKDVKLPPFTERTLGNGLKVFVVETREVPMVTVRFHLPAGSALDPRGKEGLAELTATMLMRGAGGIGAEEMAVMIESVGGSLETGTGPDETHIAGDFMARDLSLALDLLAKVVTAPDFPAEEFEREKGIVVSDLISGREDPYGIATKVFIKELLGDHPYADPGKGYIDSVEKITLADVAAFHKDNFVPEGCILAVVGDIDAGKALKEAEKRFGGWKGARKASGAIAAIEPKSFPGGRVVVIDKPDATQSMIRIGNIGTDRKTPDYFPLEVANSMLGGGFTSRLMDEIRVNRGLSYGVRSIMNKNLMGGYFGVFTYTKNQSLRETIDVALAEIGKMSNAEASAEELEGTERYISGLFPFDIETNADIAQWMVTLEFYGLGKDFVESYRTSIDGVTAADVRRVAGKYFHDGDNLIVVLTNYAETASQLQGLGEVRVIKAEEVR